LSYPSLWSLREGEAVVSHELKIIENTEFSQQSILGRLRERLYRRDDFVVLVELLDLDLVDTDGNLLSIRPKGSSHSILFALRIL